MENNNRYTREYERGEVYLIEKAGAEPVNGKRPARPGIIVSSDEVNKGSAFVSVVYTTSKEWHSGHVVPVALERPSLALCEHVEKVSKGNVGNYLKRLSASEMERIDRALKSAFGLNGPKCEGSEPNKEADNWADIQKAVKALDDVKYPIPKFEIVAKEEPESEKLDIALKLCLAEARAEARAYKDAFEKLLQKAFE